MSHPDREVLITEAFVSLADSLVDDYDVIDLLDRLVGHCVRLLAAEAAGLMLADVQNQLHAVASSSADATLMELLQLQAEEGPCMECFHTAAPISVPDITHASERWPRFVAAVRESGPFSSVHALPLRLRGQAIGALNLLHREAVAIPPPDLALGQALADIATIAILQQRAIARSEVVIEQLQTALTSRVVIEQAKGVLAEHFAIDMNRAFAMLRTYARNRNLPLSQLARLISTNQLDPTTLAPPPTGRR